MQIPLTAAELAEADQVGRKRHGHDTGRIRDQKADLSSSSVDLDIRGARAERVIVRLTGYPWNAFRAEFWNTPKAERPADVGPLEVRTNNRAYKVNMLLFKPGDPEIRPYVLVVPTKSERIYEVAGWRFGFECAREAFWMAQWPRPCWAVPQQELYRLASLEAWCKSHGHPAWKIRST